jgi:hypothetical protein
MRQRSSNCQPRMSAPALSWFHRLHVSPAPPAGIGEVFVDRSRGPALRGPSVAALGLERKGPVHVSVSGVAKGRCMVPPSRRLAGLVSFGNLGTRDCVTPNFSTPIACASQRICWVRFRSVTWVQNYSGGHVKERAEPIRADKRKVKLRAEYPSPASAGGWITSCPSPSGATSAPTLSVPPHTIAAA